MGHKTTSPLRNFIAAASIPALMAGTTLNAADAQDNAGVLPNISNADLKNTKPSGTYMSEETDALYGEYARTVNQYLPGMTTLLIRSDDLGISLTPKELEEFAIRASCDGITIPQSVEYVDAMQKIKSATQSLYGMLQNIAHTGDSPFPENAFGNAVYNNPIEVMDRISEAASNVIMESAAMTTLDGVFPEHGALNFAVVSMPNKLKSVEKSSEELAAIPFKYLENIKRTKEDEVLSTIAHEFGHAYLRHRIDNQDYYCVTIDPSILDESNIIESEADIIKARIIEDQHKLGNTSGADINAEEYALRSLGALYATRTFLRYTGDISSHTTTQMHDLIAPDFQSDIDLRRAPESSKLPSAIALVADVMAGAVALDDIKKAYKDKPDSYSQEDQDYFNSLSAKNAGIITYSEDFRIIGEMKRTGEMENELRPAKDVDPQYLYEAVAYMDRHGVLDKACKALDPQYAEIVQDIVADFLDAADKYASKLKNPQIEQRFEKNLNAQFISEYAADFLVTVVPQESLEMETAELVPYR